MVGSVSCATWGDPGGADLIGCERLDDVSRDEILLGLGLTLAPLALAAPAAVSLLTQLARWAFPAARIVAHPRWWTSGMRAVVGGLAAAQGLSMQIWEHGSQFSEYNLSAVAFDYVLGVAGYAYASWVLGRYGVQIVRLRSLAVWRPNVIGDWVKLGRQQVLFTIYATVMKILRKRSAEMSLDEGTKASLSGQGLGTMRYQATQAFLLSAPGKALFPMGTADPRVACMSRVIALVESIAVKAFFGLVPDANDGIRMWSSAPPPDPIFGRGLGF